MDYNFPVTRTTTPKEKPTDESSLGFGKYFTDHMFMMDYDEGQGWHDGRIIPYGPICFDPGATTLHYGQMMFEGLKAYRNPEGTLNLCVALCAVKIIVHQQPDGAFPRFI